MSEKNNKIYKILNNKLKKTPTLKSSPPIPEKSDYANGYITRFFARQANSPTSSIIEINDKLYYKLIGDSSGFYKVIELDWKITGDLNSKLVGGVKHIGVLEANQNSINEAEKEMTSISSVLGNLVKYYKPFGFGDDLGLDDFDPN